MKLTKRFTFPVIPCVVLALVMGTPAAWAASYNRIATISVPGNLASGFDISWVDQSTQTYYLADRGTGSIDVIDAEFNTYLYSIPGFVGNGSSGKSGPDGVLAIPKLQELWVGDGDSTVKVVDLLSKSVAATIYTGGMFRADELAYDPQDQIVMIANDRDTPPFVTFISTKTRMVLGHIFYPQATSGLEQPVWDSSTRLFYMSVPATTTNPGGEVDAIDPKTMTVINAFPVTDCNPAGLALGPKQNLLLGCGKARSIILDARNGKILANITQVGGSDEVWYNPGDHRFYLAASSPGGPVFGVINADTNQWITNVPTAPGAHSIAVNSVDGREDVRVLVPFANVGVVVFATPTDDTN